MSVLLDVDHLKIDAREDDGSLRPIVKSVSFNVKRGEAVALIGESGSGKTSIALAALGYAKPGLEFTGGEIRLDGRDVLSMAPEEQRDLRGRRVAYLAPECRRHLQSRADDREAGEGVLRSPRAVEPGGGRPPGRVALPGGWNSPTRRAWASATRTKSPVASCRG